MGAYSEEHIRLQEEALVTLEKEVDKYEWSVKYHEDALASARLHLELFLKSYNTAKEYLEGIKIQNGKD